MRDIVLNTPAAKDAAPPGMPTMIDGHGRTIDYVRLSLTDRCDLRCLYCMPAHMTFLPRRDLLTADEIGRLAWALVARGVRALRLTGGEPLVRRDLDAILCRLAPLRDHGLDELTVTTNGTQLMRWAPALAAAGVRRINVSLDTLDPLVFARITRGGRLDQVLDGIAAAQTRGIAVKINMVAQRGVNQAMLPAMLDWCEERGLDLSLIETMPLGQSAPQASDSYIPLAQFMAPTLDMDALVPVAHRTTGPARYYRVPGRTLRLGLISPLSRNFCAACNRIRITAVGRVYMCLGREDHVDLRTPLRDGDATELGARLDRALRLKPAAHDFVTAQAARTAAVDRTMNLTGG